MEPPRLIVKLGTTLKLKEFENVRIDFQVEDSLRPEDEGSIEIGLSRLYDILDKKLSEKAQEFGK